MPTVIALFVAVEVVDMLANTGLEFGWGSFKPASAALLRRNLLRELLTRTAPAASSIRPARR